MKTEPQDPNVKFASISVAPRICTHKRPWWKPWAVDQSHSGLADVFGLTFDGAVYLWVPGLRAWAPMSMVRAVLMTRAEYEATQRGGEA